VTTDEVPAQVGERTLTRWLATWGGVVAWVGAVLPTAMSHHRQEVPLAWWPLALVTLACFVGVSAGWVRRHGLAVTVLGVAAALAVTALWGTDQTSPVMLVLMAGAGAWVLSWRATAGLVVFLSLALAFLLATRSTSAVWTLIYASLMSFAALMIHVVIREGRSVVAAERLATELAAANARLLTANGQLEAAQARLAEASRAQERLRISRDLHDGMGNQLTALSLTLDLLGREVTGPATESIAQAKLLAAGLLRDTRNIVSHLRESKSSVRDEIARLARALPRPHTSLDLAADLDEVSEPVGEALVRVVQESLTNVARHSSAENAWVQVVRSEGLVHFEVRDDGSGARTVRAGNGLSGMAERVALLGGELTWSTNPGAGFLITGWIPDVAPVSSGAPATDERASIDS
jgi:signal transduction histidine kinase